MINLSPFRLSLKFYRCDFGWFTVGTNDTVYLYTYICGKQRASNKWKFCVLRSMKLCFNFLINFMVEQIHKWITMMSFRAVFGRKLE